MANKMVNQGLQSVADLASSVAGASGAIRSLSIDDSTVAFTATDTALNSGGAVTTEADANFDSTPTRSGQTVTHTATFGTGVFNGATIKRIALHNNVAASVDATTSTLVGGIDGQTIAKNNSFAITFNVAIAYTDAS